MLNLSCGSTDQLVADKRITMWHIIVAPVYANDRWIGSRVGAEYAVELDEDDPRFRAAVVSYHGDCHGIAGGPAILRRFRA
jgi:hypothetical protein